MDPARVRESLERARSELRAELEELTAAPRDPMASVSFGKRIGEGTSQAVERIAQVDAARQLDAKLRDVERALEKFDEGTYGTCDVCGRPIASERLEAIPWAVLCVDDAASRAG
ncbi:MAG TPA: TraR/DksA C4-type zinc finger protein [Actinomycetota bacterium]|nr:TraR/DksA C4-type zinc finger protein [Actinomycetota bacterium]